jgi:hypothetical protein
MKDYLGDGVYVEFNGDEVILSAPRPRGIDRVILGRHEYEAFKRFMSKTPWENETKQ